MALPSSVVRAAIVAFAAWTFVACGRFGFDATDADEPDAAPDAAPDARPPFSLEFTAGAQIAELVVVGTENDDPSLTGDMLEIYFAGPRAPAAENIFRAVRTSIDDVWSTPELVAELNSPSIESTIAISTNGLWMIFGSDRDDLNVDVYLTSRPNRSSPFAAPRRLTELASAFEDSASWISDDGLTVLIHSTREDNDSNVYVATRGSSVDSFGAPTLVEGLSTPDREISATLHFDRTLALLAVLGPVSNDLFVSEAVGDLVFGPRMALVGPNTDAAEVDPWLSPDGCTLIFVRDVGGLRQIFEATCIGSN